jgi:hypothetical protein
VAPVTGVPLKRRHTNAILPDVPDATLAWVVIVVIPLIAELAIGNVNETDGAGAVKIILPTTYELPVRPLTELEVIVTGYVPVLVELGTIKLAAHIPSLVVPEVFDMVPEMFTVPIVT